MNDEDEDDREYRDLEAGNDGMLQRVIARAQRLPGAGFAQRQMSRVEVLLLRQLKTRMERLDDEAPAHGAAAAHESLGERLAQLLERATEQTREQALETLYHRILDELVPDEARIVGALSDGAAYPLLHIAAGPTVGPTTRRIADNFSNIGKPAGVKLLERVPTYIGHLRALALVESAPEDKELEIKYQILESDQAVRRIVEGLNKGSSARYIRRTLRLSEFGGEFWRACTRQ